MDRKFRRIIISLCCLSIFPLLAQTYDLQFVVTQNDRANGGIYQVRAEIRAETGSFGAGSGNFAFDYNHTALDTGSVSVKALTPLAFDETISTAYDPMTITRAFLNTLSLGSSLTSVGNGQVVMTGWLPFALITFTITDMTQTSGLAWRIGEPNTNTILFLDNENTLLTAGDLGNQDDNLPVELSAFTAVAKQGEIQLNWTTQSEINNLGFEVYRSDREDGNYLLLAGFLTEPALQGAGNSNVANDYTYEDESIAEETNYWYQLADVDFQGIRTFHSPISVESGNLLPEKYALLPNFPNPFNPTTNIQYEIPAGIENGRIKLVIYNSLGMKVKTLKSGKSEPGIHNLEWDGRNEQGFRLASGIYFLQMEAQNFRQVRKMILLR